MGATSCNEQADQKNKGYGRHTSTIRDFSCVLFSPFVSPDLDKAAQTTLTVVTDWCLSA